MPVGSGGVDRPLGPIKASTKVLERWFVRVSLGVESGVKRFDIDYTEKKGDKSENDGVNSRLLIVTGKSERQEEAVTAEKTVNRRLAKRWREERGLNGAGRGDRLGGAVAPTWRAVVRCELPVTTDGRYRNKTRSQAGCGSPSPGIGAPAFGGIGQRARDGRAGGARHEGAPGARAGVGQPGARGVDAASRRCVRRAFAGSRGGGSGYGAGFGGRDFAR